MNEQKPVLKFKPLGEMVQRSVVGGGTYVLLEDYNAQTNLLVEAQDYIKKLEALVAPVPSRAHILYRNGDSCIPESILDRNGQVALDLCTVCGKGEAELDSACPGGDHPKPGRYDAVLKPFRELMERELHANAYKGDRPGWLKMTPGECLLEIYYHVGKLHKAVHGSDSAGISEYAADVANLSMMLTDITGVLCDHEWVDARNPYVKSGEICAKLCGAIRAGNGGTNEKA